MYFVMLNHPNLPATPLLDGADPEHPVAFFESLPDAKAAGEDNPLGENFGYEVFQLGYGEI